MYRYFDAWSDGNPLHLAEAGRTGRPSFTFPRQAMGERLCLADFVAPQAGSACDIARAPHHDGRAKASARGPRS